MTAGNFVKTVILALQIPSACVTIKSAERVLEAKK